LGPLTLTLGTDPDRLGPLTLTFAPLRFALGPLRETLLSAALTPPPITPSP